MAISSERERNAALLDECGILIPQGVIDDSDRETMVGDYKPSGSPPPPSFSATGFEIEVGPL